MPKQVSPRRPYSVQYPSFLPPALEHELLPLVDRVFDTEPGQAVLYETTSSRAKYLARMVGGLRNHSAIESLEVYPPDSPLYAKGLYAHVFAEAQDRKLVITVLPDWEPDTVIWTCIRALATGEPRETETKPGVLRAILLRYSKRYPIFKRIWIQNGPPTLIHPVPTNNTEVIVDIDTNPDRFQVAYPKPEDRARADAIPESKKDSEGR